MGLETVLVMAVESELMLGVGTVMQTVTCAASLVTRTHLGNPVELSQIPRKVGKASKHFWSWIPVTEIFFNHFVKSSRSHAFGFIVSQTTCFASKSHYTVGYKRFHNKEGMGLGVGFGVGVGVGGGGGGL